MKHSAYGRPIFIGETTSTQLKQIEGYDEKFIQDLVFDHPDALPIDEIDDAYTPLIPVCTELQTAVGPLDVLLITPAGRLAVVETKLWRNPESRRKVVAQIIDYAKELSTWDYADLQREVNRRLNQTGNTPYRIACGTDAVDMPQEAAFVDAVSRNLRRGRFLLLVVGDGIREGAASIAEFLSNAGHLEFGFGLVELAVYGHKEIGTVITPRVIARTVELNRVVIEIAEGMEIRQSNEPLPPLPDTGQRREFYTQFWREFVSQLQFDDPAQPPPNIPHSTNLFLTLPVMDAWISAYFMSSKNRVGVYLRRGNTQAGRDIARRIEEHKESIIAELGGDVTWTIMEDSGGVSVRLPCDDVFDPDNRDEIKRFFAEWLNRFVNVFRPLLKNVET